MHNVSNRPKQTQFFIRETSCYELAWVPVNPSLKKKKSASVRLSTRGRLLKLFPKLRELPFQIRDFLS
jgi:hypothetical protein